MPKRKIRDSLVTPKEKKESLDAIREALCKPLHPSNRSTINRGAMDHVPEYETVERRGERVYRTPGKAGADLAVPPYYWEMLKRRRDFEAECAKVDRSLRTQLRNRTRTSSAVAEHRAREIIAEFNRLAPMPERNRASVVAAKLKLPVRTVRDILKKSGNRQK
ncbi:MAG TPA: hypothetical protein VJL61_06785 [Rhodanobacteraceae bacterium]|nr:hypothetical protein [Rhodanobacteraceae bacterium]